MFTRTRKLTVHPWRWLMPDEPEVDGLLALLLLTESRRASRRRPDGSLVVLAEQDRERWADAEREFLTSGGRTSR